MKNYVPISIEIMEEEKKKKQSDKFWGSQNLK